METPLTPMPSPTRESNTPPVSTQGIELPPSFHKVEALVYTWMEDRNGSDSDSDTYCVFHDLELLGIRLEVLAEIVDFVRVYVSTNGNVKEACRGMDHIFDLDDLLLTLDAWKPKPTHPLNEFRSWCLDQLPLI